ncbi:MAG: hypothetical protein ABI345_01955, partial [Jatrophihabitans sp.]
RRTGTSSSFTEGTGGRHVNVTDDYGSAAYSSPMEDFGFPMSVAPPRMGRPELDLIVDSVVERIEQRVIDELERRGRRHTPGVF